MRSKIRVALIHAPPAAGDLQANWLTFERLARLAKARGADLCISPECFLDGYAVAHCRWRRHRLAKAGSVAAAQYLPRLQALAKELPMMLLLGMTYSAGRRVLNSAFLVGPDGRIVGRYDKTHLLGHDRKFDPGMALPVFPTPWGKMGIMICADRRWPECPRTLRVQGARLILCPSYGMSHLANQWWLRTRSYENECFICFAHPQVSLVTDPHGNVLARRRSRRAGLLLADLKLTHLPTWHLTP